MLFQGMGLMNWVVLQAQMWYSIYQSLGFQETCMALAMRPK